ncbi:TPA: type II toxin-antitoxin system HicB family antitoxin [Mannheimia haemolytica]|uniref:Type II toxin-antitoxin system HicB family antitoxin n=1 Tax=Mannheimia haemolytica TaxID=75985 RepID=A0A547EKP0_MANHA|nr:type II toxin-antitoxin system HicB family antitoxin [Mannheimia haemolytica]AWW71029.1 type II toxin-antitoxin system HicB family antitoxin [Pasteurellaceae bacterium 12565]AGI32138.1 toxin-antitoxin system HicB family antitoxin [Mannheimia haemolytica USDA-ARS-USMARC-183]AGI35749.1 toxin-antitoxin system HicB family antitoxin [Mannheimia haemolytica USDA-ARS-USMARC-185]AGK03034.1 putative HicB-like protein [Mannheimia haemolytica M42548]AGQ25121.1 DNA repair protein HhH-GPD [Mannheimia ha
MRNIMDINGYKAVIAYDPETELFRGEFIGLNGGADFYADNVIQLKKEGELSLNIFLELCREKGIEPFKQYSGKFNVRLSPELHKAAVIAATAENLSLNEWINQTLEKSV